MAETQKQLIDRRFGRKSEAVLITLIEEGTTGETKQIASTVNYSDFGLRIKTAITLVSGQRLYIPHFGHCRVKWVRIGQTDPLCEAGLEIVR